MIAKHVTLSRSAPVVNPRRHNPALAAELRDMRQSIGLGLVAAVGVIIVAVI